MVNQAIEAKESLDIQPETQTLASITYQNFFLLYPRLAGMTGTAKTEEVEFEKLIIYKLQSFQPIVFALGWIGLIKFTSLNKLNGEQSH